MLSFNNPFADDSRKKLSWRGYLETKVRNIVTLKDVQILSIFKTMHRLNHPFAEKSRKISLWRVYF